MKILHCCLAAFYIDNYGYQENILPKMHRIQGHDVRIVASTETYINNQELGYIKPSSYINENSITVVRLPYVSWIPKSIVIKLRMYVGLLAEIVKFDPDVIFLHDIQFVDIVKIKKYAQLNPRVRIYADGHTDYINSATNWVSKYILHKLIYKKCAKLIEPFVHKFFGVTPLRVDFFKEVYGISEDKIDLLVMGVDDSVVDKNKRDETRQSIRGELGVSEGDFLLVTGGKIDLRKNIHVLMKVVNELDCNNVKLVIFGVPDSECSSEFTKLSQSNKIISLGWLPPDKVYDYFFAADLGYFPGTHSVLWEQAVGVGLPCVFRRWKGMEHVDFGGNCLFLENGDEEEMKKSLYTLLNEENLFANMKSAALGSGAEKFLYSEIAKKAIAI